MSDAITNTSPLLYLYRLGGIDWLPQLFHTIWAPAALSQELLEGRRRGYDVPVVDDYPWLQLKDPQVIPSEWLAYDLGPGELAALSLALEHRERVILLDDRLGRRVAQAAGLRVWGTLRVLLEAKSKGLITSVKPYIIRLQELGMWISDDIRVRILMLADEFG